MTSKNTKPDPLQPAVDAAVYLFDDWFDPIEATVRDRVRGFIQAMIEGELDGALERPRYGRRPKASNGDDCRIAATAMAIAHGRCWAASAASRSKRRVRG